MEKYFRPGQYLFREGQPSDCMYLIKKGTVAIRKMKDSHFVEIARLYANEVLGELSFFDRRARSASAVAITEVEVLELKFDALDKLYRGIPEYLRTIMASVADRLRKANEMIRRLQRHVIEESGEEVVPGKRKEPTAAELLETAPNLESLNLDALSDIPATSPPAPSKGEADSNDESR